MCNADVQWVPWRATGSTKFAKNCTAGGNKAEGARAVRVASGVHVGRVLYHGNYLLGSVTAPKQRCHVVIFGRSFAFNCYELLVLSPPAEDTQRIPQPDWTSP